VGGAAATIYSCSEWLLGAHALPAATLQHEENACLEQLLLFAKQLQHRSTWRAVFYADIKMFSFFQRKRNVSANLPSINTPIEIVLSGRRFVFENGTWDLISGEWFDRSGKAVGASSMALFLQRYM
jgi:hypothetical protein